jgi:hypothetical protein
MVDPQTKLFRVKFLSNPNGYFKGTLFFIFFFFTKRDLRKKNFIPALQKAILKWQKDKKFFRVSQMKEKTIFH